MSTILKALKKLDEEKRASAQQPLAGRVLTTVPASRRRSRRSLWLVSVGALCGLLLAVLAGVGYVWLFHAPSAPPPAPVAVAPSAPTRLPAALPPASPVPAPIAAPEPAAAVVTNEAATPAALPAPAAAVLVSQAASPPPAVRPVATSPPAAVPSPPPAVPVPTAAVAAPAPAVAADAVKEVSVATRAIPAPGQQWSATQLRVTEIFPGTGSARMAMVNGLPVMAGTWVDNALVREIRDDQVLFDIDGKSVAVPVSPAP